MHSMCRIGFLHPGKQCHNPLVHGSKALDSTPSVEIVDIQNDAQALPVHFLDPGTADMVSRRGAFGWLYLGDPTTHFPRAVWTVSLG